MGGLTLLLRVEWVFLFLAGVVLWLANGGPPLLLIPAWLLVDISMIGYLGGPLLGSFTHKAADRLTVSRAPARAARPWAWAFRDIWH